MKILFIQKMAGISGSERYFLSVLPKLRAHGLHVAFLLVQHPKNASKNTEFISVLRGAGVPVFSIDSRASISPWLIWKIAQVIREHGFDVVQSNLIHADVWVACIKRLLLPDLRVLSLKHGYSEAYQTSHGLDPSFVVGSPGENSVIPHIYRLPFELPLSPGISLIRPEESRCVPRLTVVGGYVNPHHTGLTGVGSSKNHHFAGCESFIDQGLGDNRF